MIAVAVISIAIVTMLGAQSQSISLISETRFKVEAAMFAQQKATEIRMLAFDDVQEDSGNFGEGFADYEWKVEIDELPEDVTGLPDSEEILKSALITVSLQNETQRSFSLQVILYKEIDADEDE